MFLHMSVCMFCSLFNDTLSIPDYTSSDDCMIGNSEFERMWKEAETASVV
jgi:hypothetical protein